VDKILGGLAIARIERIAHLLDQFGDHLVEIAHNAVMGKPGIL
jgi:hypothetical protein